jgi:hypothetical protein
MIGGAIVIIVLLRARHVQSLTVEEPVAVTA